MFNIPTPIYQKLPKPGNSILIWTALSLQKNISAFDLVLLSTDHDDFDYNLIERESNLIIDTRGKFNDSEKVIKA